MQCEEAVCLVTVDNAELRFEAGFQFSIQFSRYGLIHQEGGGVSYFHMNSRFNASTLNFTSSSTMSEAIPLLAIETGIVL